MKNSWQQVFDSRKRRIRGLWKRNGHFYAQMRVTPASPPRRIALKDPDTHEFLVSQAEAVTALNRLLLAKKDNLLPVFGKSATFRDFAAQYLDRLKLVSDSKRPSTIKKEEGHLNGWIAAIGHLKLAQITPQHVDAFVASRRKSGISGRTCDLDIGCLNNVLKRAQRLRLIQSLPTVYYERLAKPPPRRPLWSMADIEKACFLAVSEIPDPKFGGFKPCYRNGLQFADYIKLLAFTGARAQEGLRLQWKDIDFQRQQVAILETKNQSPRFIDFNPALARHLIAMRQRRAPDSDWLFPSPMRGEEDLRAGGFPRTMRLVTRAAGMEGFQIHDLRHYFISMCLMNQIDVQTVAAWVGHKDGGVLIGKVYGHLYDSHKRQMAKKLSFRLKAV